MWPFFSNYKEDNKYFYVLIGQVNIEDIAIL